jgi:hypothetical protein
MLLRFGHLILLSLVLALGLISNSASAQNPPALLIISSVQVQLGNSVNFEWACPSQLLSGYYYALPLIYAQITINRVQEVPTSMTPYVSPPLPNLGGPFSYTPPTVGTFTVILRCHYLGTPIGLGDFSCPNSTCKNGGEFVVTTPPTTTSTSNGSSSVTPNDFFNYSRSSIIIRTESN